MPKPVLYLAGPMAGCDDSEASHWRAVMDVCLSDKYEILNPMVRDFRKGYIREKHEKFIVETDIADIRRSDIVVVNPWKPSPGTSMEMVYAHFFEKLIVTIVPESASPWITYHSTILVPHHNEAIDFLRSL